MIVITLVTLITHSPPPHPPSPARYALRTRFAIPVCRLVCFVLFFLLIFLLFIFLGKIPTPSLAFNSSLMAYFFFFLYFCGLSSLLRQILIPDLLWLSSLLVDLFLYFFIYFCLYLPCVIKYLLGTCCGNPPCYFLFSFISFLNTFCFHRCHLFSSIPFLRYHSYWVFPFIAVRSGVSLSPECAL